MARKPALTRPTKYRKSLPPTDHDNVIRLPCYQANGKRVRLNRSALTLLRELPDGTREFKSLWHENLALDRTHDAYRAADTGLIRIMLALEEHGYTNRGIDVIRSICRDISLGGGAVFEAYACRLEKMSASAARTNDERSDIDEIIHRAVSEKMAAGGSANDAATVLAEEIESNPSLACRLLGLPRKYGNGKPRGYCHRTLYAAFKRVERRRLQQSTSAEKKLRVAE